MNWLTDHKRESQNTHTDAHTHIHARTHTHTHTHTRKMINIIFAYIFSLNQYKGTWILIVYSILGVSKLSS